MSVSDHSQSSGPSGAHGKTTHPADTDRLPIDAGKREQLEFWLGHFAQIDLLTELPNRKQFLDRLTGAMARAVRSKQQVGVMLLNLDRFKSVNATYGHRIADLVLKALADRLKECTRKSDTAARLGGDEFAVILEALDDKEGAAIATNRLQKALSRPISVEGRDIVITATVGIAFYPSDADNVDTLLHNADLAMSHAKQNNRNTCEFYSPQLGQQSRRDESNRMLIKQRLASLTPREREVLQILVDGKANKMIAYILGTSTRTIENHRARIMAKMNAHSLPELVRMMVDVHEVLPQTAPKAGAAR